MMATVQPSNNSELQLYRVLQRANLLQYFETFITQGGDDVQQLCEAGEDEFLEIMALVGMASKPLHVRRLQKALQEWVANPAAFEVLKKYPTHVMSMGNATAQALSSQNSMDHANNHQDYKITSPQSSTISTSTPWTSHGSSRALSPTNGNSLERPSPPDSPQDIVKDVLYMPDDQFPGMLGLTQPALLDHQIAAIATAATLLAQNLPPFEPKSMPKKQISKEISYVMTMTADDPNRMAALRKYAAIYGRFDSKRKNDRPMSLHEISVNEAAAQLCSHFPALLTRREELFPLARQVVRDSGYQYSKGHSRIFGDLRVGGNCLSGMSMNMAGEDETIDPKRANKSDPWFKKENEKAAEVLVQPKIEQSEAIPSTSSLPLPSPLQDVCSSDSFNDLQNELTQITLDLSEMAKEQDRIRSALRVLLEANDHDQMKSLTSEMDDINDRQTALIKKRQKIVNSIGKYRKGVAKYSATLTAGSPMDITKHPFSYGSDLMKANKSLKSVNYVEDGVLTNPLNTLYMAAIQNHKDSLFEEGLRIATQYGMSDFAQELIGMKSKDKGDSSKDLAIPSLAYHSSDSSSYASDKETVLGSSLYEHYISGNKEAAKAKPSSKSHSPIVKNVPLFHPEYVGAIASDPVLHNAVLPVAGEKNNNSVDSTALNVDSTFAQGSTTTTTTITTKTGQVIEVETRRSSRRKNGEPDYYLINGGEKRFRSGHAKRSSSTSSERSRKLSSSSSSSTPNPGTPTMQSPGKQLKLENPANGEDIQRREVLDHLKPNLDPEPTCDDNDQNEASANLDKRK
uniref:NAB co-repressor domain-containing protein n=1 Tax=Biomphalaria glabrata TaxID=6526 RepID=A0A2C9JU12_BIOGL